MWARTLYRWSRRCRLVITRRRRQGRAGKSEVEVVEARFWLVLARSQVARGLDLGGSKDSYGQASKPRVEKTPKGKQSGRQAGSDITGSGILVD